MNKIATSLAGAVLALSLVTPVVASEHKTRLGVLSCDVEGGVGLLLGSSKAVSCSFKHADGSVEKYAGRSSKIGLDVGITGTTHLKWVVFTPVGNEVGQHALAGKYVGIAAAGSLGIGLGANALVGGSNKKVGRQPLSIEAGTGVNIAMGVASLTLNPM